jgi:lambda family phage portal protein
VFHLYQELRPGQVRGIPWLHAVTQAIWDLSGYTDAERARAKAAACLVGTVEGGNPEEGEPEGVDGIAPAVSSESGEIVVDSAGNPVEQLSPGLILYAPDGKKVVFNQAGVASNADWVRVSLREIAAGVGLSYESFTGDFSQGNFSFSKLGQAEQRSLLAAIRRQIFIPLAMDRIWEWFITAAIAAGLLPDKPELYDVLWSNPQYESADREADATADRLEMRLGLRSRREIIASRGKDPDAVDADIIKDQVIRDELGIVSDGDPRQTSLSGTTNPDRTDK